MAKYTVHHQSDWFLRQKCYSLDVQQAVLVSAYCTLYFKIQHCTEFEAMPNE